MGLAPIGPFVFCKHEVVMNLHRFRTLHTRTRDAAMAKSWRTLAGGADRDRTDRSQYLAGPRVPFRPNPRTV